MSAKIVPTLLAAILVAAVWNAIRIECALNALTSTTQESTEMFTHSAVIESLDHVMVTVTVSDADADEAWRKFREECQRVATSNVLS